MITSPCKHLISHNHIKMIVFFSLFSKTEILPISTLQ